MGGKCIEALIVEHSHETGVSDSTVRLVNLQLPLLLLARGQAVAEGCPLQLQFLFGHGTADELLVTVALTILHPCEGQQEAVAVLLTVGELAIDELAILLDGTFLNLLLASKETIYNIGVGI